MWLAAVQGAWRMRGLLTGQRVEVLVTPEMARLLAPHAPLHAAADAQSGGSAGGAPVLLACEPPPEDVEGQLAGVSQCESQSLPVECQVSGGRSGLCQLAAWLLLSGVLPASFA